ncbi:uncharacterized protein LOC113370476 [Ctenocephalides felis]|uniref:uncharacterized protein LOC113370476 n=1 Tax=Ctenocephalides felis TaxID=7515 RepID=UPI000E6E1C91|nr:uncharacterized protein LOC113370476 [Ctenocephalides felis]
MKKYYQLSLIIISFISLVLVIIYRNEYNRLRYVLEVLNFFGKPNGIENNYCNLLENVTMINKYNVPIPAWQNIGDAYIYSAFWDESSIGGTVQALGISKEVAFPLFMCSIWYTNQIKPVKGKFSTQLLSTSSNEYNYKLYIFSCRVDKSFGVPFNVMYYKDSNIKSSGIPVYSKNFLSPSNSILACIKPTHSTRNPTETIEFLNFHQVLGIKNYIIYDNGILVPSLLNPLIGLDITVLPWNLPFYLEQELVHQIIENDCLMRTKNAVEMNVILNWNELIVPSAETSVSSLINAYDPLQRFKKFQFSVLDFCLDFQDEENNPKTQVIFHKLHYKKKKESATFLIRSKSINDDESQQKLIDSEIAIVQRYVECFKHNISNKLDRSSIILRFNTDFVKTYLYKLWITGSLFK